MNLIMQKEIGLPLLNFDESIYGAKALTNRALVEWYKDHNVEQNNVENSAAVAK